MDDKKKIIDGQVYWHISLLSEWGSNEKYRILELRGKDRLYKSLRKKGVKEKFQIDENGTTYDGNNRLRLSNQLLSESITKADNGTDLAWIPVQVNPVPTSEVEAIALAAISNGENNFAYWNKNAVANDQALFEQVEDFEDLAFTYAEPETFEDVFDKFSESEDAGSSAGNESDETCMECQAFHSNKHIVSGTVG